MTPNAPKRLQYAIYILILSLMLLVGWLIYEKKSATELAEIKEATNNTDWLASIKKETVNRTVQAKHLIQSHFPKHDVIVLNAKPAPGGALVLTTSIDGKERNFVLLADNKNFIEGALNSPYLDSDMVMGKQTELTRKQAKQNSVEATKYNQLKSNYMLKNSQKSISQNTSHMTEADVKSAFVMPEVSTNTTQATKRDLLEKTKKLQSVVFGKEDAPSIYVYFDFECPSCLLAHKTLKRLTDEGLLKVHYVPVGLQSKESIVRTAYSLIPDENEKRRVIFDHMKKTISLEKLLPTKANETELKKGLMLALENKAAFLELPNPATPTFIYEHNGISYISIVQSSADIKNIVRLLNN